MGKQTVRRDKTITKKNVVQHTATDVLFMLRSTHNNLQYSSHKRCETLGWSETDIGAVNWAQPPNEQMRNEWRNLCIDEWEYCWVNVKIKKKQLNDFCTPANLIAKIYFELIWTVKG